MHQCLTIVLTMAKAAVDFMQKYKRGFTVRCIRYSADWEDDFFFFYKSIFCFEMMIFYCESGRSRTNREEISQVQ